MSDREPLLFVLDPESGLGCSVAARLGLPAAPFEERRFEDGELKIRPRVDVARKDVYILSPLHGGAGYSVNDRLVRLLLLIGGLKDSMAERVAAVVPCLAYARKDARTQALDPLSLRYIAQLLEAVGMDRIVVLDVHNLAAFENAFRCPKLHLEAAALFANRIAVVADAFRGDRGVMNALHVVDAKQCT